MNRRGFFRSLVTVAASACAAPLMGVAKAYGADEEFVALWEIYLPKRRVILKTVDFQHFTSDMTVKQKIEQFDTGLLRRFVVGELKGLAG